MSKFSEGDKCAICDKPWVAGGRFARHHTDYEDDTTVILCYVCHTLLHGSAKIWKHPFGEYGRDMGPYLFAKRVVAIYEWDYPDKPASNGGDV